MASERVVKVTLTAQMQNYLAGMEKARKVTQETATEADKLAKTRQAFDQLGRGLVTTGGLMAAGLGVAVAKFAEFDEAMSAVAATGDDARNNLEALSQAAIDAGASTVFSATEAAGAIENLAKAGLSSSDILGGALTGSLDLAAAGGLAVAEAAEIAATTLQQFGLEGEDAVHVADLLAAGAGKAMGDVTDMAAALKQSGLVADQFGISVEETTGALAAFASQGLLGSDAGTSFKTMLLQLAKPSREAAELMEQLGINAYDAQGNFVGLEGLAGELEGGLAGLTDQQKQSTLATIFGTDAIRAATVLYEEGAEGIADWTEQVDDAGYASETAATRLDNLKGDFEALQGAVDSALIGMGSAADGPLRALVQSLTGLVDKFNELPAGAQQAVFWVGLLGATGATALGSYLLLVPKIAEFNAAIDVLGPKVQRANRAIQGMARLGAVATAIGVTAVGVDFLADEISKKLLPSAEEVDNKFKSARSGVELFAAALQSEGINNTQQAGQLLKELGTNLDAVAESDFWNPASISGTAVTVIKEIAETAKTDLPAASRQFQQLAEDGELTDRQIRTLIKTVPELQNALLQYADTSEGAADAQDLLNVIMGEAEESTQDNEAALRSLAGQAETTGDEVEGLAEQIRNFGSVSISVKEAQAGLQQSLDDLTASVAENGATLDLNEQAGRDNQAALIELAQSSKELAAATYERTQSEEEAKSVVAAGREELIRQLEQFGLTGDAAEQYADDLGLIPENIETFVDLNGVDAAEQALRDLVRDRVANILVRAQLPDLNGAVSGSGRPGFASGGAITGSGPVGVDSVPIMAAPGEHMWTAEEVRRAGGHGAMYAMRDAIMSGRGFNTGNGGDTYNFHGQYAMSADELMRAAETEKRRRLAVAGV